MMLSELRAMFRLVIGTARDLAPIIAIIGFFQFVVLRQPITDLAGIGAGLVLLMFGLAVFIRGLEMALFPLGEALADALARKGSLTWLTVFSFALGFGTTVAEPALIAVCDEAAEVMAGAGVIPATPRAEAGYARALRYTVAISVGTAIVIGVYRILKGWPIHWMIIAGYGLVIAMTALAPVEIVGIAYDSGGVTTSTITVPLVTALGVGLATVIRGRNPVIDGFGLIAFASLLPIIFVLGFGMVTG